jgi:hypothetical protein
MMIGIGTPRSQSRIPRPMELSFQPTVSDCPFPTGLSARGNGKPSATPGLPCLTAQASVGLTAGDVRE